MKLSQINSSVKRFYLSCMALAETHGGGLTLLRIVPDILEYDRFVHVHGFALFHPPVAGVAKRQLNVFGNVWLHRLGCAKISNRVISAVRSRFVKALRCFVSDPSPQRKVEIIARELPVSGSNWLVVPQGPDEVIIANELKRKHGICYVTWMMDDHVVNLRGGPFYSTDFEPEMRFHLTNAHKVFVISPAMGVFYKQMFGTDSEVLFSPCEKILSPRWQATKGKLRLAYFGSLGDWQKDPLCALAESLPGLNAELHLFTRSSLYKEWKGNPSVCWQGGRSSEEVESLLNQFDGIVVPASFRLELKGMTSLNIPTKLAECLGSGTVPIIIAPADSAIVDFLKNTAAALIITNTLDRAQMDSLCQLRDADYRRDVIRNAQRLASGLVSRQEMSSRWSKGVSGVLDGV